MLTPIKLSRGNGARERLPDLLAKDLAGHSARIDYRSTATTVLYVFSPSCPWCERNSANLASLATQLPRDYRLIGLSLSSEEFDGFVKPHAISFPVYRDLNPDMIAAYRFGPTPEAIVIGPSGTVIASWQGAFVGPTKSLIEKYFSAHLPDLQQ